MKNTQNVQVLTQAYATRVEQVIQEAYRFMAEGTRPTVSVEAGRKYFKLVADYGNQRSVHSFVDRVTGDVLKAASWNAPAKGARYNLVTGMDVLLGAVTPHGAYLYQNQLVGPANVR